MIGLPQVRQVMSCQCQSSSHPRQTETAKQLCANSFFGMLYLLITLERQALRDHRGRGVPANDVRKQRLVIIHDQCNKESL